MKKSLSIVLLIFVMLVVLRLAGVTYGYYAANIINNTNSYSLSVKAKYLEVEYFDGTSIMNFNGDYLFPGDSAEKTFTIKNTGTDNATYNILIDNVVNEFERIQDLQYILYINDEEVSSGTINNNSVQYLYGNRKIAVGSSDNVKFLFKYATTDEIQNIDMNKTISFRFNVDTLKYNNLNSNIGDTLVYSKNSVINNFRIYGNSVQEGTPSIQSPVEIKSLGDKTKNLWSLGDQTFTQYKEIALIEPIEPGNYTISCSINSVDTDSKSRAIIFLYEDNTQLPVYSLYEGDKASNKFTATKKIVKVRLYASDTWVNATGDKVTFSNVQVEPGSKVTDYEPYGKYKIPIKVNSETKNIYLNEPLRKTENYADYIDFSTNTIVRYSRSLYLNIDDMNNSEGYPGWSNVSQIAIDYPGYNNYLVYPSKGVITNFGKTPAVFINTLNGLKIVFFSDSNLKQSEYKANFPNTVFNLQYVIPKPEIEKIQLPEIFADETTNVVSVETSIEPSNVHLEYFD